MTKKELQLENEKLKERISYLEIFLPKSHDQVEGSMYQYAFTIGEEKFFVWSDMLSVPVSRRMYASAFLQMTSLTISEAELKKTYDNIFMICARFQAGATAHNMALAEDIKLILNEIQKRNHSLPLLSLIYRLMAFLLFKEDDDFSMELDMEEVLRREELFKSNKKKVYKSLYLGVIANILNVSEYLKKDSEQSFQEKLEQAEAVAKYQRLLTKALVSTALKRKPPELSQILNKESSPISPGK